MRLKALLLVVSAAVLGKAQSVEGGDSETKPTTFNSITVPPILQLSPANWREEIKKSRLLLVKHFSPYCPHCTDFAPTYQTMYEFYYTSTPADGTTFEKFYNLRFGMIDCVSYSDFCEEHQIKSFPTTVLYENGQQVDLIRGNRDMEDLSKFIEAVLEKEKPGSRPKTLELPAAGDKESPKSKDKSDAVQPPVDAAHKSTGKPIGKIGNELSDKNTAPQSIASSVGQPDAKHANTHDSVDKAQPKNAEPSDKSSISDLSKDKQPNKPHPVYNTNGISVSLTSESFQQLVTRTQDPWFIKFYAPWCHHCQAMAPTWDQLAKSLQGKLNIGQVNCEVERHLCKSDLNVAAYPTIIFFKGGERAEYAGLRGLGDFVQYAEKAVDMASGVPDVDAESFRELEKTEDVIFVYFYDQATTSEDFAALERLPLSLIGHAKLVKTNDVKMYDRFKITTWPRLLVSREGRPTYYPPLTPDEMRDVRGLLDWMRSVWLPLVPELTPSNARQIMDGKIVVLGILNHEDREAYQSSLREMKSAANEWIDRQIQEFQLERKKLRDAKQMRIEEAEDRGDQRALRAAKAIRINMDTSGRREATFAWVDGLYWQRWIRTTYGIDVKDGERIVINDEDNRRYWDNTVTGNHILVSRTSIMETLDKIVYGPNVIKHKLTVSVFEKILLDVRVAFSEHPFLSLGCVAGIGFGLISWLRGRSRRRGGHFRLDDGMGMRDLKDGILGANGNHKAD
ncbi:hypothetical protein CDD82_999 [Ophiocordyceps australis]|uniref:Thioredoxin domain-containing protein n=1 Tax=Ophiocordyceps australis TaxID=1399860 RepID=A0A2C5YTA1_9HYPO|nr:hypothetical protein CDD82_999 [Ophiocordyceps australis]